MNDSVPLYDHPMWASGLDRELDFPDDLINQQFKGLDGVNRISSNYNQPTEAGLKTILNYQKQLENGDITVK